jgi:transcriptional regulator CtsR
MSSLANKIQLYLNQLLDSSSKGYIEVQRNKLAERFLCVPSQINYVLTTRFTVEQGYMVETRQGGGGYLRIIKLPLIEEKEFIKFINSELRDNISEQIGEGLINRLYEEDFLTLREAILIRNIIRKETLGLSLSDSEAIRSRILKVMLCCLMRKEFE